MKFKIEWRNVGRGHNSGKKIVRAKNIRSAEKIASIIIKRYLLSSDITMIPKEAHSYTIFAGFHSVGEVIITEVK